MFEKLLQYVMWSVTGFTPLSASFSLKLGHISSVVDKFALWQALLQANLF
jgi:hypothetical protein